MREHSVPKNPDPWPRLYWFRFGGEGLPVSLPSLKTPTHLRWRRIHGGQFGRWFFGVIEGGPGTQWTPDPASPSSPIPVERGGGKP